MTLETMLDVENIKVVGFDLDQTLYPKSHEIDEAIQGYIHAKISEKKGINLIYAKKLFDDHYLRFGSGRKALMGIGFENGAAEQIVQDALESEDIINSLKPNQEDISLLKDLNLKFGNLSLITGSSKEVALKKLDKLGIKKELFNFKIYGEDSSKSNGAAFIKWIEHYKKFGINYNNLLYVGDRKKTDVDLPLSLGINAILVYSNEENPDFIQLNSLKDLRNLLL